MDSPYKVRTMLRTYGKQLTSAKRLARFRRALRMARAQDAVTISRQAKRRDMVQRVAKEIIENLIVASTDNPVIQELLEALEYDFGSRFVFEYPLDGGDVQILRESSHGPEEVGPEEKGEIMKRLWELTMAKVDQTML